MPSWLAIAMPHPWKTDAGLVIDDYSEEEDEQFWDDDARGAFCSFCATPDSAYCCACDDWPVSHWVDGLYPGHYKLEGRLPNLSSYGTEESDAHWRIHDEQYANIGRRKSKRQARKNWMILKDVVDKRCIAVYWMQQTQERLCAPGGAGRATDLANFQNEFDQ